MTDTKATHTGRRVGTRLLVLSALVATNLTLLLAPPPPAQAAVGFMPTGAQTATGLNGHIHIGPPSPGGFDVDVAHPNAVAECGDKVDNEDGFLSSYRPSQDNLIDFSGGPGTAADSTQCSALTDNSELIGTNLSGSISLGCGLFCSYTTTNYSFPTNPQPKTNWTQSMSIAAGSPEIITVTSPGVMPAQVQTFTTVTTPAAFTMGGSCQDSGILSIVVCPQFFVWIRVLPWNYNTNITFPRDRAADGSTTLTTTCTNAFNPNIAPGVTDWKGSSASDGTVTLTQCVYIYAVLREDTSVSDTAAPNAARCSSPPFAITITSGTSGNMTGLPYETVMKNGRLVGNDDNFDVPAVVIIDGDGGPGGNAAAMCGSINSTLSLPSNNISTDRRNSFTFVSSLDTTAANWDIPAFTACSASSPTVNEGAIDTLTATIGTGVGIGSDPAMRNTNPATASILDPRNGYVDWQRTAGPIGAAPATGDSDFIAGRELLTPGVRGSTADTAVASLVAPYSQGAQFPGVPNASAGYTYTAYYRGQLGSNRDMQTRTTTCAITVNNVAPTAEAGPYQAVAVSAAATLTGSSTDAADPESRRGYCWTQTGGTSVGLPACNGTSTFNGKSLGFTAPATPGPLTFQLMVNDGDGATATDTTRVDVITTGAAGTINGRVTCGPCGDTAVANAMVDLYGYAAGGSGYIATVRTDDNGYYTFTGLAARTDYMLLYTKTGYSGMWWTGNDKTGGIQDRSTAKKFTGGGANPAVYAGISLSRTTDVGSISGTTRNTTGAAVGNIVTKLYDENGWARTMCSNGSGVYSFTGLPPKATYRVSMSDAAAGSCSADAFSEAWYDSGEPLGNLQANMASLINVPAATAVSGIDVRLSTTASQLSTFNATVTDNASTPVALSGIQVRMYHATTGKWVSTCTTGATGMCAASMTVLPGTYKIWLWSTTNAYVSEWWHDRRGAQGTPSGKLAVGASNQVTLTPGGSGSVTEQLVPAQVGLAVGDAGAVFKSIDGGDTWARIGLNNVPTGNQLNDVKRSGNTAIAVGNGGTILRSSAASLWDVGNTWTAPTSGTANALNGVATDGAGVWVAVGATNTVLRSIDDGVTWGTVTTCTGASLNAVEPTSGAGATRNWTIVGNAGVSCGSTNNGSSFAQNTAIPALSNLYDVAANPINMTQVIAVGQRNTTTSGMFYGTTSGVGDGAGAGVEYTPMNNTGAPPSCRADANRTEAYAQFPCANNQQLRSVAVNGTAFLAVGDAGTVRRSTGLATGTWPTVDRWDYWRQAVSPNMGNFLGVAAKGTGATADFVGVGGPEAFATATWTPRAYRFTLVKIPGAGGADVRGPDYRANATEIIMPANSVNIRGITF